MGFLDVNGLLYYWNKAKEKFNKGITGLSAKGTTITYTKGDGSTGTINTQDTTYGVVSKSENGLAPKLPDETTTTKFLRQDGSWAVPPDSNTTYSDATQSTHGLMTAADKKKLDGIASGANAYTHPTTSGNKHIPSGGSSGQILRWSADGTAVWGADKDTTYGAFTGATEAANGSAGLVPTPDSDERAGVLGANGKWNQLELTKTGTATDNRVTLSLSGNASAATGFNLAGASQSEAGLLTGADKKKLDGIASGANAYTHPTGSGYKHIPSGGSAGQFLKWSTDGTAVWANDNDTTYSDATQSTHGLMSTTDKAKLDALPTNATLSSIYAKKSDIVGMYKYKGSVADASKLPTSGQTVGDVYNIEAGSIYGAAGANVAWNGSAWDSLGEIFQITAITNEEIDAICV